MKPGDPTGTTYKVPGHNCSCNVATVKIRGAGPWLCLSAVNSGRDWERDEAVTHLGTMMAVTMDRQDIPMPIRIVMAKTLKAAAIELARKAHVTE